MKVKLIKYRKAVEVATHYAWQSRWMVWTEHKDLRNFIVNDEGTAVKLKEILEAWDDE